MTISNTEFKPLVDSKGGLFDVSDKEMEANIGREVGFHVRKNQGLIHRQPHIIVGIQKTYSGELAYRVELSDGTDSFGRPAYKEDIYLLD